MKINKFLIFTCCMLFVAAVSYSQNPTKTFSLSTGYSSNKSWFNNLSYEFSNNGYNRFGAQAEHIIYHENGLDNKNILSLGLFYKRQFAYFKNFSANWLVGGAAGTDNTDFYYYPFGGFEQIIYPNRTIQFFIAEKAVYLFNVNNNWQPSVNAGIKISL